jgi:hypothetical protein
VLPGGYNQHLVTDAGAGFLAVGVALLVAAVWMDRRVVQVALIAEVFHTVPHFLFHLAHPSSALSTLNKVISTGGLGFDCVVAVILLYAVSREGLPARAAA